MSKTDRTRDELLAQMREIVQRHEEGAKSDGGRKAAAIKGEVETTDKLVANDEAAELASLKAQLNELRGLMKENRKASKAAAVGGTQPPFSAPQKRLREPGGMKAHKALRQSIRNYKAGEIVEGLADRIGLGYDLKFDPTVVGRGKASLESFLSYGDTPMESKARLTGSVVDGEFKATLGATGATGGYVLPNNLVDSVIKPATQKAVYQQLVTVVNGVSVRGVDMPYRTSAAQRATFIDWGALKTNVNEAYGSYTAYLATMAIIYDLGKQYVRFSAGSAEQDVMDEITRGMILGENYYMAVGAGTGTIGTGDPTVGVYTALNGGANAYKTAFSPVATTLLGSVAEAITTAGQALAARSREATAWVTDAVTYWTAIGQGTDTAGFWLSPTGGPSAFTRTASGGVSFWGQPIYYDANLNSNSGTTKIIIGGEWASAKLYRGLEFRIDTTDIANTRWDYNLIGFRGEEEIGFNASTPTSVGAFQLITSAIA